jgi:hypothetical protein
LVRERVHLQNQIESLLEEGRIKLSSVISDLLGVSGRRILRALAQGETDTEKLAGLGDEHLKCGRVVLADAVTGSLSALHQTLLPGRSSASSTFPCHSRRFTLSSRFDMSAAVWACCSCNAFVAAARRSAAW